jgi:hypothetical protein
MPVQYAPRTPRALAYAEPTEDAEDPQAVAHAAPTRSNAAGYTAIALVIVAVLLMHYTLLIPVLLGFLLLSAGVSLLGTRVNPLTPTFYLTTKPTWLSIAIVFLAGVGLFALAYHEWRIGGAPIWPGSVP